MPSPFVIVAQLEITATCEAEALDEEAALNEARRDSCVLPDALELYEACALS